MPLNLNPFNAFGLQLQGPAPQRQMAQQAPINIDAERRKREQAAQMLAEAVKGRRIVHPNQGYAQMGEALLGVVNQRRADKKIGEYEQQRQQGMQKAADAFLEGNYEEGVKQLGMFDPELGLKAAMSPPQKPDEWIITGTTPGGQLIQMEVNSGEMKTLGSAPGKPVAVIGPDGQPKYVAAQDAIGMTPYQRGGQSIVVGPDGTVEITDGMLGSQTQNPYNIESGTRKMAEDRLNLAQENLLNLELMMDSYDDRFLTLGGKAKAFFTNANEKGWDLGLAPDPTAEDLDFAEDMAVFHSRAWKFGNAYIKYITGAQMSEVEAQRIMLAVPNAGKGNWFDGMAPSQFKAVLDDSIYQAKLAEARYRYLIMHGFMEPEEILAHNKRKDQYSPVGDISLQQMDRIMKEEWKVHYNEAIQQGASPDDAASYASQVLNQNYGTAPRIRRPETAPPVTEE